VNPKNVTYGMPTLVKKFQNGKSTRINPTTIISNLLGYIRDKEKNVDQTMETCSIWINAFRKE
jgi:hypothetical protein